MYIRWCIPTLSQRVLSASRYANALRVANAYVSLQRAHWLMIKQTAECGLGPACAPANRAMFTNFACIARQ